MNMKSHFITEAGPINEVNLDMITIHIYKGL